jgi:hypothetical protein
VLPQTESELILATLLLEKKAILGIGHPIILNPDIKSLLSVGKNAKTLIDGFGAERIVKKLEEVFFEK